MEFDFEKHGTVADINVVPNQYRGLYTETKQGNAVAYTISDTAKGLVEAYVGTHKALNTTRNDLKTANNESASRRVTKKAVLDFAKELGLDSVDEENPITSIKTHIDTLVEQVKGGKDIRINLDKVKSDHQRALAEVTTANDAKLNKMGAALSRYLIDQAATAALAEAKGSVELLLPHVKGQAKVVQDGEDYVVRVVDAQGDFRMNGKGGYMSVADLVAEMKTKENFGRAFASEQAGGGSGSKPGSMSNRTTQKPKDELTSIGKISQGLKKGQYQSNR